MIERWVPIASSYGRDIDFVFDLVFWMVMVFWFLLAEGAFIYLIVKGASRKRAGKGADYITGELQSEKRWVTYPHYAIMVCDIVIVVVAVKVWYDVKQYMPVTQETVRIVAQQWAWSFVHAGADGRLDTPDDIKTVDDLHLELGKTYRYELASRDVLHSLSIPVFRLKQDAIPGRVISGWFQPTKTGTWDLQCAEICGIGHALMPARVLVETAEQHQDWIKSLTPTASGE